MKILNNKKKIWLTVGAICSSTLISFSISCSNSNKDKKITPLNPTGGMNKELKDWNMNTNTLVSYEDSKKVPIAFSKTDKNVLVLGIDTLGNSEINLLKNSDGSEYKSRIFNNFINYKNITAAGRSTNTGMPALIGGWLANPLLWSDKRIDVYDRNETFDNLDTRTEIKQMYTWKDYQRNNYKEFINAIDHDKYDFKALNTEYFAGGDELGGDSISVEGFKKTFPEVESALQYWEKTSGSNKNIYKNEYKLDYPKLKWHHNYFEKMRKNVKTYVGKGKFNWSWAQQLHPSFFKGTPENPETPKTTAEKENNEPVVKHSFNQVEKMFQKMKQDGVWDNTLIFIVSDHGYKIREEAIMMVKPWNNKEKYSEVNNVMLSNYDFPMILDSYMNSDFDETFYKRAELVNNKLFATKYGYKLGNYVEKPLDPNLNTRKKMFNIHHNWAVKKNDTMLNFVNYYGEVLDMRKKTGITWQKNGTASDLFNDFVPRASNSAVTKFENVHIKEIQMIQNEVKYGIYNSATNPNGYSYRKSSDFLPNIRPFNNSIGRTILEKIRVAKAKAAGTFYKGGQ